MKITITTTPKTIENVSYLLGKSLYAVMQDGALAKALGLSAKDVAGIEQFRQRVIKQLLKK